MNDQLEFGFLFKGERLYWDRTVDDWQPSRFTPEGYAKQLQLGRERLQNVLWPAQEICRQGIEACNANLVRMMKPVAFGPDEPRTWPSVTLEGVKQRTEFVQYCIDMVDEDWEARR